MPIRQTRAAVVRKTHVSENVDDLGMAIDEEDQARDDDFIMGGSSEESTGSSEADWSSESLYDDNPGRLRKSKPKAARKNAQQNQGTGAKVRSVEAAPSQLNTVPNPVFPLSGGFAFLDLESYVCHCANPSSRLSQPLLTGREGPSFGTHSAHSPCKVLAFFGLVFLETFKAVFCPTHNYIVPMSEWATHIRGNHSDWCSTTKKNECARMAKHVADIHDLSVDQTEEDFKLPDEIDEPLLTDTRNLNRNYLCPLGCGKWIAEDKGSNNPERFIREKHILSNCIKGQCPRFRTIDLDEPRWVYKVQISVKNKKFHSFVLPLGWERGDDEEVTPVPEAPSLDTYVVSVGSRSGQDWPVILGWPAYDQEISADNHVISLRSLLLLPHCDCKKSTRNSNFLENGLHLVHHAIVKYFRTAMLFVHKKHKRVVDAITLECVFLTFNGLTLT